MNYMGTDLVSGGWNAIDNILATGTPFPAQQRVTVKSETTQAAGGTGQTFRPTAPENPSMVETEQWRDAGWWGSPYQDELSIGAKTAESQQLAEVMGPKADPMSDSLDWALSQTKKVTTLFDELKDLWQPREVIVEKPREGSPEGKDVRNLNQIVERGAEVIKAGTSWIGGVYDQVKGLFNIGFDQTGKQPAFSIQHELEPTTKIGIGVIAAVVILVLLLRKR